MATRRLPISAHHAIVLIALGILGALTGCASIHGPKVHDALTPAEHLQLGVSYERGNETNLALREYERAAVGPTTSAALTCQGNIYAAWNDFPTAEAKYRAALQADPDNLVALNNLAWQLAHHNGSLVEAEALIRRALALNPTPRAPYEDTLNAVLSLVP